MNMMSLEKYRSELAKDVWGTGGFVPLGGMK